MQAEETQDILDTDQLLRRVLFLDPNHIKPDGSPTSFAFSLRKDEDGLSVDVERLTTYQKSIQDVNRFRLFKIGVTQVKSYGLTCEHNRLVDGSNEAHALIKGITKSSARKMAENATRVNFPD